MTNKKSVIQIEMYMTSDNRLFIIDTCSILVVRLAESMVEKGNALTNNKVLCIQGVYFILLYIYIIYNYGGIIIVCKCCRNKRSDCEKCLLFTEIKRETA